MAMRQSKLRELDRIEKCAECGQPTGRAGAGDDSIFCSHNGHVGGPYCLKCYHELHRGGEDV